MSSLDKIYVQLLNRMTELEEFLDDSHFESERKNKLISQDVTIHFMLNGEDKYLNLNYNDIFDIIKDKAQGLRHELSKAGKCEAEKSV